MAKDPDLSVLLSSPRIVVTPTKPHRGYVPVIYFDGQVTQSSVDAAIGVIEIANEYHAHAIVLEIDTPGGNVDAGKRLVKTMERSKAPIDCVVDGDAMSMGFYILQSCTTRTMTDDSVLMVHGISAGVEFQGKVFQLQSQVDQLKAEDRAFCVHEAQKLTLTADQLCQKVHYREWYLNAPEALRVHAVDVVVPLLSVAVNAIRNHEAWPPKPNACTQ